MKLAYRRSTGELIPDFQERATEKTLMANAIRRGIPAEDVDVRQVSLADYRRLEAEHYAADRAAEDERQNRLDQAARALQQRMGWTTAEVEALRRLVNGPPLPPDPGPSRG